MEQGLGLGEPSDSGPRKGAVPRNDTTLSKTVIPWAGEEAVMVKLRIVGILLGFMPLSWAVAQAPVYQEITDEPVSTRKKAPDQDAAKTKERPRSRYIDEDEDEEVEESDKVQKPAAKTPEPPAVKIGDKAAAAPEPELPPGQRGVSSKVFLIRQGARTEVVMKTGETFVIRKDSSHNKIMRALLEAERTGGSVSIVVDASGRVISAGGP